MVSDKINFIYASL